MCVWGGGGGGGGVLQLFHKWLYNSVLHPHSVKSNSNMNGLYIGHVFYYEMG